jgi:predicted nucleic acid-binding protein
VTYVYADSSALTKLVLDESESIALRHHLGKHTVVTSALTVTEVQRAARRSDNPVNALQRAHSELGFVLRIPVDSLILGQAGRAQPPVLRTLDAIHLATVEHISDQIEAAVCYDRRLSEAITAIGIPTIAPGQD